jgi:hypothetical protein
LQTAHSPRHARYCLFLVDTDLASATERYPRKGRAAGRPWCVSRQKTTARGLRVRQRGPLLRVRPVSHGKRLLCKGRGKSLCGSACMHACSEMVPQPQPSGRMGV